MTKTDVGAAGPDGKSKQGAIYVPKDQLEFFGGELDPRAVNPSLDIPLTDWKGEAWTFKFTFWNQKTRNEYRLEGTKEFQERYGVAVDTELRFWRDVTGVRVEIVLPDSRDEEVDDPDETRGVPEGARSRAEVNRYERSGANRQACIDHYGRTCACCDMSFAANYGPDAANIIHVHHITPVSRLGEGYEIDPIRDLRPICPNCHAVVHQAGADLLTIDDVRSMLKAATAT